MPGVSDLPVADPRFVVDSAGDGVTLVTEPNVHPLLRCTVWHVRCRDVQLVVDTSLALRPLRHLVEQRYVDAGCDVRDLLVDALPPGGLATGTLERPATPSTTGRCSTGSTAATSRRSSTRCGGSASCR